MKKYCQINSSRYQ